MEMRRGRRLAAGVVLVGVVAGLVVIAVVRDEGAAIAVDRSAPGVVTSGPPPCGSGRIFDKHAAPPIPDRDRQQAVVDRVTAASYPDFAVHVAQPTALGVYALVTGDLDAARTLLTTAGVTRVERWDAGLVAAGAGGRVQIQMAMQTLLDPVIGRVREVTRRVPGDGGMAVWPDAGAVLVSWKAPVPAAIAALADHDWGDGVRVIVEAVPYSTADLSRAQGRVDEGTWARYGVTTVSGCGDDSGLEVGIGPDQWPADPAAVQARLTDLVGLPVALQQVFFSG
jgi:hypothetical protein